MDKKQVRVWSGQLQDDAVQEIALRTITLHSVANTVIFYMITLLY